MDQAIKQAIKEYILEEFLPDEEPDVLTETVPLITGGILDSFATLKLVAFLEKRYGVRLQAHEATVENMNTLGQIVELVESKMG